MRDKDGLTFSGPVEPERGRVHTPSAFMIPSWRSVHPSKEEMSRMANPSFAGLAIMFVFVAFAGFGLAFVVNGDVPIGLGLLIAGAVTALAIYLVSDRVEHRRDSTPSGWYLYARGVVAGVALVLLGVSLVLFLSEFLLAVAIGICALAWGLLMLVTSLRE